MKLLAQIEYNGAPYAGWQRQTDTAQTVQGHLERALSQVAAHPVQVVCAGRTDSGVHATGQIIHFETTANRKMRGWLMGTNTHLPPTIRVKHVQPIDEAFHARFSAIARAYEYHLKIQQTAPAVGHDLYGWHYQDLCVDAMQQAAQYWVGTHDFTSFRAANCQAHSPIRTIAHFNITRQDNHIVFHIKANAFLYNMIRIMVGTLMVTGAGEQTPEWAKTVLAAQDRCAAGPTAMPNGLYLSQIWYPPQFEIK